MKKYLLIILPVIILSGCEKNTNYSGEIMMSTDGRFFEMDKRMGDLYFIREIDSTQIDVLREMTKNNTADITQDDITQVDIIK